MDIYPYPISSGQKGYFMKQKYPKSRSICGYINISSIPNGYISISHIQHLDIYPNTHSWFDLTGFERCRDVVFLPMSVLVYHTICRGLASFVCLRRKGLIQWQEQLLTHSHTNGWLIFSQRWEEEEAKRKMLPFSCGIGSQQSCYVRVCVKF